MPAQALAGLHPVMQAITAVMVDAARDGLQAGLRPGDRAGRRGPGAQPAHGLARNARAAVRGADPERAAQAERDWRRRSSSWKRPRPPGAAAPGRGLGARRPAGARDYERWCECAKTADDRALLAALNDERNPALAERIDALHREGQRVFAAVGALHMTGPQALPALLRARGFTVERVRLSVRCTGTRRAHHNPETAHGRQHRRTSAKLVPGLRLPAGPGEERRRGAAAIGQWVAPTLNPEELEKRIEELRTVQFWLEQNARMLAATIQALEVQRMTLSTLKTMNVPMAELRDSLKVPEPAPRPRPPAAADRRRRAAQRRPQGVARRGRHAGGRPDAVVGRADASSSPQLATTAMKDSAGDAAKTLAGAMVKQSFDAAEQTLKKAAQAPGKVAGAVAKAAATKARRRGARAARARARAS